MNKLRILLIDDDPNDRALTIRELKKEFSVKVEEVKNEDEFKKALENSNFDIVITDYQLRWSNGLDILHNIKAQYPDCPVIMFTGTGNEEVAVEAMKNGLDDYIVKSPKHFMRIPAAIRLILKHLDEREERKWAQKAFFETEEKFRKIFESSPNAIMVANLDGNIIECNQAMLELHGFASKDEVIGRNTFDLISKKDQKRAMQNLKKIMNNGLAKNIEYTFQTKEGREFPVELVTGVIKDLAGKPASYVALTKDISEQKRTEDDLKKRMLKFKLDDGNLYLVKEPTPAKSLEAFKDLLKIGYKGTVVSRTPEKDFHRIVINSVEYLWLAEKGKEKTIPTKLDQIEHKIERLPRKNTVFIDRLDYLIFKNGFNKALSFLQHLRELAYLTGNIIITSIDPDTLGKQQLSQLEKECIELVPRLEKNKLSKELFNILKYIYQENGIGVKPSYINIGTELGISRPTIRKRIRKLISAGYLLETPKGKNKVVELTEMGRSLFLR